MQNQEQIPLHPIVKKILEKKGYKSKEDLDRFFSWDLKTIPNLTLMNDLEKAALRIYEAIKNNERIGIYGDYDVDGTTSCALLFHFFEILKVDVKAYQPSRFGEGYGVHKSSIDAALKDNIKVLITVDCGISNLETADYTHDKDIDLIITDHHKDAAEHIPRAFAVVNPNRRDDPSPQEIKDLAGVGVAFALAVKIRELFLKDNINIPSLYPLLQFLAIGTISDLAKLSYVNLRLVRHGLSQLKQSSYEGIKVFFTPEEREISTIDSEKVSFTIGPMINSKGRLDHPELAFKLLISKTHEEAFNYYSRLELSNRERKFIQSEVFEDAKKQVIKNLKATSHDITVVYSKDWHEGVIGIVASKLVETFKVPAVVFTNAEEEGIIKASARSVSELNIFDLLHKQKDLFIKFGGHKSAAGLSIKKESYEILKSRLEKEIKSYPEIERTLQNSYDLEISFNDIDRDLAKGLELLGPFGMGNERPIFKMSDCILESYQILRDIHVKWFFTSKENPKTKLTGISFNYIGKWGELSPEEIFSKQKEDGINLKFSLNINHFRGNEIIQLMVDKISLGPY